MKSLKAPFIEEKVKTVVFSMEIDKTPRLDKFSSYFYQSCWDFIKSNFLKVFHEFYNRGILHKCAKATFIALTPKKVGSY